MKFWWRTLAVAIAVVFTADALMYAQTEPVAVAMDGIDLKDVGSDRIHFSLRSHVTADRNLKIKRVRFERMRLGNLPIYLSPIVDELQLEKGTAATLPPIPVTFYFRDLDSLAPLEQAVHDGQVSVEGKARADLDLTMIERAALRQWVAHADLPIAVKIPVEVPGGVAGRTAALVTLRGAQIALNLGGSSLHALRTSQKGWEAELQAHYIPAMVVAESRYSLQMPDNQRADFVVRGLGFRISEDKFVLTDEMVAPWKYDADATVALQTGKAWLVEGSPDLLVWPSGEALDGASARSLARGQIRVEYASGRSQVTHVSTDDKNVKVKFAQRDSDANYAVLRFVRPEDKGTAVQLAPEQVRRSQNWDRLTLFRVDETGKLEVVSTPAHREESRLLLDDPIDDRGFGSLLIAPEGAVGMVQDERTGMALRTDW